MNETDKGISIGGLELGQGAVLKDERREFVLLRQGSEDLYVRGITGFLFGLFFHSKFELFKENVTQLLMGLNIEFFPGNGVYPLLHLLKLAPEIFGYRLQAGPVHTNP